MKYFKYMIVITVLLLACNEQELIDLNKNANASSTVDWGYLLTYGQLQVAGDRYENWRANLIYSSTMIQHHAALAGYWSGDKYYYNVQYSGAFWERHYPDVIKNLTHLVDNTAEVADLANIHSAALLMRSFDLHRMTDMYGDIPYEQAGRAIQGADFWFPVYDRQQDVYGFLVRDIRLARDGFSSSATALVGQDVLYNGDLDKWKMFANSLLMRVAIRMSNVDETQAQAVFVEAAVAGAFASNEDEAFLSHTDGPAGINRNGTALALSNGVGGGSDANNCRVSKFFLDWMNANEDPRKMIIVGGVGNPFDEATWNTNSDMQKGLPNGFTSETIKTSPDDTTSADLNNYSFINPKLWDLGSPYPFISYAEVELMMAEAALLGWISSDAETHFNNGVRAAIKSWEKFDASFAVASDTVANYITGLNFAGASEEKKKELIGEQYWAATYLNHIESWSNWRRTGYPSLTPTNDPNSITNGTIPRRLRYFEGEIGSNFENYQAAKTAMGGDLLTTRVWWDDDN